MTYSNLQGKAKAFWNKANVTGWLTTTIWVYVARGPTETKLVAGLYGNNNGHPGTLLAQ